MIGHLLVFVISFYVVLKATDFAIKHSVKLSNLLKLSEFAISFFVVAAISSLPETIIAFFSQAAGHSELAVTALIGSDVIDVTLVFGILALFARGISVHSPFMKKDMAYLFVLTLPLFLGIDGTITRWEGAALVISGVLFLQSLSADQGLFKHHVPRGSYKSIAKHTALLILSVLIMMYAATFTVNSISVIALDLGLSARFVAVLIIGTGVCLPELLFSIQSVRQGYRELALGNILGVIVIDSTIILGLLALVSPLVVDVSFLRVLLFFAALSSCVLMWFIKSGYGLSKREGVLLLAFYGAFIAVMFSLQ